MKKLTALLLVLITALSLCACGVDSGDDAGSANSGSSGSTGVVNPVTSATAEDVENELGAALTLPGRATDAAYQLIDHGDGDTKMAQCSFVLDGTECTYRAVKADGLKDISGMFYAWEKAGSCDVDGCVGNVRYNTGEEGVCFWYDDGAGIVYCISVESGAGEAYLVSLAEYLKNCADGQEPADEVEPEQPDEQPSDEPVEEAPAEEEGEASDETAGDIAATAAAQLGKPFQWGQAGPDSFDNSGFVQYCLKENGVDVGRTTGEIFAKGAEVAKEDILPGDVLFFTYSDDGSATYCGIYVGDGVFIAANNEDSPVGQIDFTDDHYQQRFVGARRYV